MRSLYDYDGVVKRKIIDQIQEEAAPLEGKRVLHINSTFYGGGVAGLLNSLVPFMNDVGIKAEWRSFMGNYDFFNVTKKIHNALQGDRMNLSGNKKNLYVEMSDMNSSIMHMGYADAVIIHDPQPLPLIKAYRRKRKLSQPWLWRCHIDLSRPNRKVWNYLSQFVKRYDGMIVSSSNYRQKLWIPQYVIYPSIDPLSTRNVRLSKAKIHKYLSKFGIPTDKPFITQISRFDPWKDPLGVIKTYKLVRQKVDCSLVLLGNFAQDDPQGSEIYGQVVKAAENDKDIIVIGLTSDILVNALQSSAAVVVQKSLREGFGLTVSEAMWKGTPVVGQNVGGIPLQITNGRTGYLVNDIRECADRTVHLLKNPKKAKEMGRTGREFVRDNFLITRHLLDYIKLLKRYLRPSFKGKLTYHTRRILRALND